MSRFFRCMIALCVVGLWTLPLHASLMGDENRVAARQLSVSKVRSSSAGVEFAVREAAPASEAEPDPRADIDARPFSAGFLWVLPGGTDAVSVEVVPLAWRMPEPGEISDSLVEAVNTTPLPLGAASSVAIMRGIPLATVSFNALQPAGDTPGVRICTDYRVYVSYENSGGQAPTRKLSATFMDIVASVAGNLDELPPAPLHLPESYLIIHRAGEYADRTEDFAAWKRQRGHTVTIVSTDDIGGTTKEEIRDYIQDAYDTWDEPPVFVVLVGDADGTGTGLPTFRVPATLQPTMCTDHPYTMLDGDDYLPDILIGRFSVDIEADLRTVVAKTVNYEKSPWDPDGAWRTRALMVGAYRYYDDYTSAWETKRWIRTRLLDHGYTTVDTVRWPGGSAYQIRQRIDAGVSFVNYRGFGSPQGWYPPNFDVDDVSSLNNGWKLPVVTSIVCGGGDFSVDECFGEAWIRYGTPQNPIGAVAFCGPSEHDTKTKWNNTLDAGIYVGILYENVSSFGAALLRGKLELMRQFPNNLGPGESYNSVHFYFHTYNILGDPGLTFFVGTPKEFGADFAAALPLGQPTIEITVTNEGEPLAEAWATVMAEDTVYSRGITDAEGRLSLPVPQSDADAITVTITKPLYRPIIETVALIPASEGFVGASAVDLVDDGSSGSWGNSDGLANPGEIIALRPHLHNYGGSTFGGGSLTLRCSQPIATILDSVLTVPTLAPGADALPGYVRFQVSDDAADGVPLHLEWWISPDETSWVQDLEIVAPLLQVLSTQVDGEYRPLDPGESATVGFTLGNVGRAPLPTATVTLRSLSSDIEVSDSTASFAEILPGDSALCEDDAFQLHASEDLIVGDQVPLLLLIHVGEGEIAIHFSMVIGELSDSDPTPRDAYGYRAYEDTDGGYEEAPTYAWVEINPYDGGPGTAISNLTDTEEGDDKSRTLSLPFPFTYYGETYTEFTVCTNGWIAMGSSQRTDFRNYALPAPLAPLTLIAPFWDDLVTVPEGRICTWYDEVGHRFIVEWSHLRLLWGAQDQSFQVILFDADCWPTATGDGEILFQYSSVSNSDQSDNYCSVGIQKPDLTTAVPISHAGIAAPGAGTLRSRKAILFTTGRGAEDAYLRWSGLEIDDDDEGGSNGNGDGIAQNGETVELNFLIQNDGGAPSTATIGILRESDPYAALLDTVVVVPSIGVGQTGSTGPPIRLAILSSCPNGRSIGFQLILGGGAQPCVLLPSLPVVGPVLSVFAPLVDDDNVGGSQGNGNSEFNPGERIELTPGVENMGGSPAYGVNVTFQAVSGPVSVIQGNVIIGDVDIGEEVYASDPALVQVNASAQNGDEIVLRIVVRDQFGTEWSREDTYIVTLPILAPAGANVADPPPGGNGDGFLLPGESGQLFLIVANDGLGTATNVSASLVSMDADVVLLDDGVVIGTVSGNSERVADTPVGVAISSSADVPRTADIHVELQGDDGIFVEGEIYITLGNAYFFNDFENPYTANWAHTGDNDRWHLQTHDYASPTHAFYFGDDGSRTYPVLSRGYLFSTAFDFDGDGTLLFDTRYQTQQDRDYCDIDLQIGIVSWTPLLRLSGTQDEWTQVVVPLNDYPPYASARLRFTFRSDASVNYEGFYLDNVVVLDEVVVAVDEDHHAVVPKDFVLEQNWPNPFNSETTFRFGVPRKSDVKLAIYDILGRQVAVLVDEEKEAGMFNARWKPEAIATGIYFVRLEAGPVKQIRKLLFLK